jgi:serine/threonine protein kinase
MSPEQAFDPRSADARSDIYSLGCTLHFLLTGKPPFGGQTFMERLLGHRERPIPSLRRSRREVPAALDATFQALLAKAPGDRPQTMASVVRQLEECRGSAGTAKASRPLTSFDDRDEPIGEHEASYQIAQPIADLTEKKPRVTSNVFVRSRALSSERRETPRSARSRYRNRFYVPVLTPAIRALLDSMDLRRRRQLVAVILILMLAWLLGWYFLR